MATGTAKGFAVFAGVSPEIIRASAREAEALGYRSFWVNHPGPVDGLGSLAHAAAETRRLLLGVGSPNPEALKRVRDGVATLRAKLSTRIIVAALGPKMCHLAGEVADGVLFNWLTPEYARRSAELVRAGADAAKRPMPQLYAYVRVALGPAASERLADEGGRYDSIPAYHAHFVRMGVKPVDTAIAATSADGIKRALAAWDGAVDEVVLRAITAKDTVEDHLTLVRAAG